MAMLQRTRVLPNQRLDLPDFNNIEDFVCADFKAIQKNIWANDNFVYSGFEATGTGTDTLSVVLAGSEATFSKDDGALFIGAPALSPLTTNTLTPSATNYVELIVDQDTGGADSRAFWDPTAAGGQGGEFSQIVDTFTFIKASFTINTSNFTGDADKLKICEVDVNGSGVITEIRDRRDLFWRLGRGSNPTFSFPWASRVEPALTQFTGADKDIKHFKNWADAVMTKLKELGGSTYWYEVSPITPTGVFMNAAFSTITPLTTGARVTWSGTELSITDSALSPADTDVVAAIRLFNSTFNIRLTRQDDGKEVQKIAFSSVPDAGAYTLEHNGNISNSINWNDNAAAVLAACNATWAAQLQSVTGNTDVGFTLKFAVAGPVVQLTINSNTLTDNAVAVTITPSTIRNGYTPASTIPIGVDEVMWVQIPDPLAAVDYNGVGVIASNYRVTARGSVPVDDSTYWLAYREGSRLVFRGVGELQVGESSEISDNIPQSLLDNIGLIDEVTPPSYSSDIRGVTGQSIVARAGVLTDAMGDAQEDRSGYLRSADVVTWTGTQLEFTSDIILELLNTKSGTLTQHTILAANSPITLNDLESAWVLVNRAAASENVVLKKTSVDAIPAQSQADKDVFVLFRRIDALGAQYLHIPFHKQVLDPGQTVRLGASGSGSGAGDSLTGDFKRRLVLSPFDYVTTNVFESDKSTKVDPASTGAFNPAKKAFGFVSASQTLISTQNLDADFLARDLDVLETEVYFVWLEGFVDTAAAYQVSRDGGANYQTVSMNRVGLTNTFRGHHLFTAEPSNANLQGYPLVNADTNSVLNATTAQGRSQPFTVSSAEVVKEAEVYLNKLGSPSGTWKLKIVKDSAGQPSTAPDDILSESAEQNVVDLASGNNTILVNMPDAVLKAGSYHLVFETSAAYQSSFSAGVHELRVRTDTSTPTAANSSVYNGSVWSTAASTAITFQLKGRALDLRLKVTSSVGNVFAQGYGVYYAVVPGVTSSGSKHIERFYFSGNENRADFVLTQFTPDPDLLEVHDPLRGQVYMAEEGVFRIDGQTIHFAPNTFNDPGEDIVLIFKQVDGTSLDSSNQNANVLAAHSDNLLDLGEQHQLEDYVQLPKIAAPFTDIANRALMPNLAQDLNPNMGAHRLYFGPLTECFDEVGPAGEIVRGTRTDRFNLVRFVGDWSHIVSSSDGVVIAPNVDDAYMEIMFYGTDLHLLGTFNTASVDTRVTIDGGAESADITPDFSGVLGSQNTSPIQVFPVATGLSEGIHRVKVRRVSGGTNLYSGIQVVNSRSTLALPIGSQVVKGKRRTNGSASSTPYASVFEAGVLGSRGGHVVVYQKADGSMAKAVNPTDAAAAYLTLASHTNEEVISTHHIQEFGQSRASDITRQTSTGLFDTEYILTDNHTGLFNSQGQLLADPGDYRGGTYPNTTGDFMKFEFVGTGVDILRVDATAATTRPLDVYVDGTLRGTLSTVGKAFIRAEKLVSGLPFGSHVIRLVDTSGTGTPASIVAFKVYGPKKPTIPATAKAVKEYFVMGDFAANATAGHDTISSGVLRRSALREMLYYGASWAYQLNADYTNLMSGFTVETTASGTATELTFFGTGFEFRALGGVTSARTQDVTVQIDGANYTGSGTTYGGFSWTPGTSTLNCAAIAGNHPGSGFRVSGLTLGIHKVRFTSNSTDNFSPEYWDIISPIYAPNLQANGAIQDFRIGSSGTKDLREYSRIDFPKTENWVQAIMNDPALTTGFTNTVWRQLPFSAIIDTKGGDLEIDCTTADGNSGGHVFYKIVVDGFERDRWYSPIQGNSNGRVQFKSVRIRVAPGQHIVEIRARKDAGTASVASDGNATTQVVVKEVF